MDSRVVHTTLNLLTLDVVKTTKVRKEPKCTAHARGVHSFLFCSLHLLSFVALTWPSSLSRRSCLKISNIIAKLVISLIMVTTFSSYFLIVRT